MESAHTDNQQGEGWVTVHGPADGFAQKIVAGRHELRSDEPAAAGGGDTGTTPYGLLLAALGSCTSMTLAMYARRKQWPLTGVTVRLRHFRMHAGDCAGCEGQDAKLDVVERQIALEGSLDDAQRSRLIEMANRCPVHRTLTSGIDIRTQLSEP